MERIRILRVVDPFSHYNVVEYKDFRPLGKIKDYIEKDEDVVVSLNGKVLNNLDFVVPFGAEIVVAPIVRGGHHGGKSIIHAIASIAVMVAAIAIPGGIFSLSLTSLGGAALSAGIALGGSMLVNAIFPAPKPDLPKFGGLSEETYGWQGIQSSIKQGTSIPVLYGKRRVGGNVISLSTSMDGQNQYLSMLLALAGHKVSSISDIKINNQPITNYKDVQSETRLGSISQTSIPYTYESDTTHTSGTLLTYNNGVVVDTEGTQVEGLRINFLFPYGIFYSNDKGGFDSRSVEIKIEYAKDGGSYVEWKTVTYSAAQAKPLRYSEEITELSAGQYSIRLTRLTKDNTNTRQEDDVKLDSFAEVIYDHFTYPSTALLGIKALATNQLSGSMPNVTSLVDRGNFDATDDYGVNYNLNGKPSNNPAWAVADILTNLTYGGNYDLDWDAFQEWATFCTTNNYEVNIYFDGTLSLWDAALRIARESKGILKIEGTKISVTIDEVSNPVQLFSVGNIIEGSFKEHFLPLESRANCCEVTFFNEDHNYQREQFMVYLDSWNTDNEIKTSLTLYGVTKYNQAISHAQYMLNYNKYLTRSGEFDADIDAIACTIGDIVKLQYDVPNWGYGGRIVSADANGVVLDQKIELEDGKDYKIVWRLQDDTQVEKTWTQSGTLTTNEIPLTLTDSEIPKEYDVYAVGETNLPYKLVRIVRIDRKDDLTRHIEWIEYNPSIYTDMPTFPALPDYSFNLDAKNLTVEQATYNSLSGDWNGFKLLWDKNSNVRKWKVYYKLDDSLGYGEDAFGEEFFGGVDFADNWHFYKTTYDNEIDIIFDNLYDTRYTFAVCGIGAMGEQNPDAAQQVSITPAYLNRKAPFFPAGSEISGVFDTKLKIWWDNAISTALSHYEVTYLEGSVQKTTSSVNNQFLVNSPIQRSYSFSIIAVDKWGQSSEPITGSITNPIPSTPSAPTLTPQFSSIDIKWTQLSDNDIVHYNIYGGKEDNQGNYSLEKLAEIKGNSWTLMCDSGETWHFTISASDPFGEGNQSPEAVATSLSASIRNYNLDLPLTKDITFSVSNSAANWTSGTLNYKGVVYNIPSGSTTYKYIWWDLSSPNEFQSSDNRPPLGDNSWLMAYFDGTNVYPATQNKIQNAGILQASSITADLIGAGQIQTTHLAAESITADKIATQTITADRFVSFLYGDLNQAMFYVKTVLSSGSEYKHELTQTDLESGTSTNCNATMHIDYGVSIRPITTVKWDDVGAVWDTGTWDIPVEASLSWTSDVMDLGDILKLMLMFSFMIIQETSYTINIKGIYSTDNSNWGSNDTLDDNVWEDFNIQNTGGIYQASGHIRSFRYFKVQINLTISDSSKRVILYDLNYNGNVINVFGLRENVSIASGGTSFTLQGFNNLPAITVTPIGSSPLIPLITAQSESSVTIKLFDLSGSDVGGNCNLTIIGE